MRTYLWLLPVLVAGCYVGPVFKVKDKRRTCSEPFLDWTGGLTYHVLQGRGDGAFDYDPPQAAIDRIQGFYDLRTGDFWWWVTYAGTSWRAVDRVEGVGTIWNDGDLDLAYTLEVELTDGTREAFQVREKRLGCDTSVREQDTDGVVEVTYGTFADGGHVYTREWTSGASLLSTSGRLEPTWAYFETIDFITDQLQVTYEEQGDVASGHIERSFYEVVDGWTLSGSYTRELDGSTSYAYDSTSPSGAEESWSYTVDFFGDGSGTWSNAEDVSCDLELVQGACERTGCSEKGSCAPPFTAEFL